jgi:hypothetical protein
MKGQGCNKASSGSLAAASGQCSATIGKTTLKRARSFGIILDMNLAVMLWHDFAGNRMPGRQWNSANQP